VRQGHPPQATLRIDSEHALVAAPSPCAAPELPAESGKPAIQAPMRRIVDDLRQFAVVVSPTDTPCVVPIDHDDDHDDDHADDDDDHDDDDEDEDDKKHDRKKDRKHDDD
jgi:hypothetical protein